MILVATRWIVRAVAICLFAAVTGPAQALTNGSFESGLAPWTGYGDASVTGTFASAPTDGSLQLLLSTLPNPNPGIAPLGSQGPYSGNDALLAAALETALGITPGFVDTLSQNGRPAFHGSAVSRNVTLTAGSSITFDWNFLTNEPAPTATYTDFFFWAIVPEPGTAPESAERLADTATSTFSLLPPTEDFVSETTYTTHTHNVTASGDYRLIFGVVDVQDGNYSSAVLIDNVAVPEPSAGLLAALGLAGLALWQRSQRQPR